MPNILKPNTATLLCLAKRKGSYCIILFKIAATTLWLCVTELMYSIMEDQSLEFDITCNKSI